MLIPVARLAILVANGKGCAAFAVLARQQAPPRRAQKQVAWGLNLTEQAIHVGIPHALAVVTGVYRDTRLSQFSLCGEDSTVLILFCTTFTVRACGSCVSVCEYVCVIQDTATHLYIDWRNSRGCVWLISLCSCCW